VIIFWGGFFKRDGPLLNWGSHKWAGVSFTAVIIIISPPKGGKKIFGGGQHAIIFMGGAPGVLQSGPPFFICPFVYNFLEPHPPLLWGETPSIVPNRRLFSLLGGPLFIFSRVEPFIFTKYEGFFFIRISLSKFWGR